MWVQISAWPVAMLVSLSKTLNHNCFVLWMGRKAVGPVCCVLHVKEPRTLTCIMKEKGLAPGFLDSHLEHPAGWICARYKSSVLLLLLNAHLDFNSQMSISSAICIEKDPEINPMFENGWYSNLAHEFVSCDTNFYTTLISSFLHGAYLAHVDVLLDGLLSP